MRKGSVSTPLAAAQGSDERVVRVTLNTDNYKTVKTLRVPRHAKPLDIINEALAKNHLSTEDAVLYDIAPSKEHGGVTEYELRPRELRPSILPPSQTSLDEPAPRDSIELVPEFRNPLFSAPAGSASTPVQDDEPYSPVDARTAPDRPESSQVDVVAEHAKRLAAEDALARARRRIKELEEQLAAAASAAPATAADCANCAALKKKKRHYKIEAESLRIQNEALQEQLDDVRAELAATAPATAAQQPPPAAE